MTTLLLSEERAAMQQGEISQHTAWINQQCRFYLDEGVPI